MLPVRTLNVPPRLNSNLDLFGPPIESLPLEHIQVHWESKSNNEANQRDKESMLSVSSQRIGDGPQDRGEQSTTTDCGNNETGTSFAVSSQASQRECEDEREDARLKEQHQEYGRNCPITLQPHDEGSEENDSGDEEHEHKTRLDIFQQTTSNESPNRKTSLSTSQKVRTRGVSGSRTDPGDVVDEVSGISYLRTDVAELGENTVEERVLFRQRFVLKVCVAS